MPIIENKKKTNEAEVMLTPNYSKNAVTYIGCPE